eukprot:7397984-Alexandrium_andersonii.AAC.1
MARCGFNPEGNVDVKGSLQAAFEALYDPVLPWLSREEVCLAVRIPKAAIELMLSVRRIKREGFFEVPSSRAG